MRNHNSFFASLVLVCATAAILLTQTGCMDCTWRCTAGEPSRANYVRWQNYLKVRTAEPDEPIATTQTQISNVSPEMAAAKIAQALESYDAELGYRLSSVFEIANTDALEGEGTRPAITDVVVNGHYYYVAFLDYPAGEVNRAAYEQTKRTIPAVAVVDAEDETRPAWIRTADEEGNPYAIKVYMGVQTSGWDDQNIYRFLRNRGYRTYGSHRLDNPTLEFDENWRPYFTVTYCDDDGWGAEIGTAFFPESLLVVDIQLETMQEYALDDPNTEANERADNIPDWVDQIYSPELILDWIGHWGYNPENYGKTSNLDRFIVDGGRLDQVMNAANTNLVFVAYITSTQQDNSTVGVMLVNPRSGNATYYPTQGVERAMATKSAAANAIRQAAIRWEYDVEDLTLHTIYGVRTWEGVLTRPAFDNDGERYGSLYAATVLLRADHYVHPAGAIWANNRHEAFTRYEEYLYLRQTTRVGSNVLEDEEVTGTVGEVQRVVLGGDTSFLLRLEGHPGELWGVSLGYLGNPQTEDVLTVEPGDEVFMMYGDPQNRDTYIVREISRR
ncbi:MAG: hypothetical protein U9Q03_06390 [Patescibacteria group bacterium]|nr:hypothetical protein [Patescibacteria group bacterium]